MIRFAPLLLSLLAACATGGGVPSAAPAPMGTLGAGGSLREPAAPRTAPEPRPLRSAPSRLANVRQGCDG